MDTEAMGGETREEEAPPPHLGVPLAVELDVSYARMDGRDISAPAVVRHPTMTSLTGCYFGVPLDEMAECTFGGGDAAGNPTVDGLTLDEWNEIHESRGYWGFADKDAGVVHFWASGAAPQKEMIAFFAHELSHIWLDPHEDDAPSDAERGAYRAAREANEPPGDATAPVLVQQELRADRAACVAVAAWVLAQHVTSGPSPVALEAA